MKRAMLVCAAAAVVFFGGPDGARGQDNSRPIDIDWTTGPATAELGDIARIDLPAGFRFSGKDGTRRFLELTENPTSGRELGVIIPADRDSGLWFVIFEFDPIGYVKDDDKDDLDADAILGSIRKGTEAANEERRRRGWSTMTIVGWHTPPHYDLKTNHLTWAINGAGDGGNVVNYSVRLLGRRGVMDIDLVLSPEQVETIVPAFENVLDGFSFRTGSRYAEFRQGDKVAAYGLTALVAGGAGAALAKSGLLGKLWKAIVIGIAALIGVLKKLLGRRSEPQTAGAQ
jgi:uncharacterized membrane-anchored protein